MILLVNDDGIDAPGLRALVGDAAVIDEPNGDVGCGPGEYHPASVAAGISMSPPGRRPTGRTATSTPMEGMASCTGGGVGAATNPGFGPVAAREGPGALVEVVEVVERGASASPLAATTSAPTRSARGASSAAPRHVSTTPTSSRLETVSVRRAIRWRMRGRVRRRDRCGMRAHGGAAPEIGAVRKT